MRVWLLLYGISAGLLGPSLTGRVAQAQKPAELVFQAEAQTLSGVCAGQPVRIEGNRNTVTLTGPCGSLVLRGFANTVRLALAPAATVRVEGSDNQVHYSAPVTPPIVALGPNNVVQATQQAAFVPPSLPKPALSASPALLKPAAAASGALMLAGEDQQRSADCAGRDVTVMGRRSAYVLRGGCRSVTVKGELLTVQAELEPGARIAVTGPGDIFAWMVKGKGRAPLATIHGAGSRIQRTDMIGGEPER